MARPKTLPAVQLEKIIRGQCWYYFVKSKLQAKTNYEIAKKVGDKQGSKWVRYQNFKAPNSTTITNVDLVCSGSAEVFHNGPESSNLFKHMFMPLQDLGVLSNGDGPNLPQDYLFLNPGFDRGGELSLRDLTKEDFDIFVKNLSAMNVSSANLIEYFGVHILLLRLFIARSKFVNSESKAAEILIRMTVTVLGRSELQSKLDNCGIYLFTCDWLYSLCRTWLPLSQMDIPENLTQFILEPESLIAELDQVIFAQEFREDDLDPCSMYRLSQEQRSKIF